MAALVQKIALGFVNCFLLRDGGMILVDTGMPGYHNTFLKRMARLGCSPKDIKLIIITHGHFDHYGSAARIKTLTGARLAVHQMDAWMVSEGRKVIPPPLTGWGKFNAKLMKPFSVLARPEPVTPDIIWEDREGVSLTEFGVNGWVIHTPGHTQGSISVLLAGGETLVGDLAMNGLPVRLGPGMPIVGDSESEVKESWRKLLNLGAKTIYPAHGEPFPASVLEKQLKAG